MCLPLWSTPAAAESHDAAIRPFRVNVPNADLTDLKRRLAATRWPDKETVADQSQGVQLAQLQELVRYRNRDYALAEGGGEVERLPAVHDEDRSAWTFTSSTSAPVTRTRCR